MKKSLTVIGIILATIVLAVVAVLTAIKIRDMGTRPVAPSAPESMPGATSVLPDNCSAACKVNFSVTVQPTLTLTPIPTIPLGCDSVCQTSSQCSTGFTCSAGHCRMTDCVGETDCVCPTPSPTPTPTPAQCNNTCGVSSGIVCKTGLTCLNGHCLNSACSSRTNCICLPTPTPTVLPGCDSVCQTSSQCSTGFTCSAGHCRMTDCVGEIDCVCPTPTPSPSPTPTPAQCNNTCGGSSGIVCKTGLTCLNSYCVNSACENETDCTCPPEIPGPYCDHLFADPTSGSNPLTVQFSGKGYDPARIKGFRFTFGDGEKKEVLDVSYSSSHIETVSHSYANNGIYKAVLEILDDGDHWLTRPECEQTITVSSTVTESIPTTKPTTVVTRRVTEEPTPTEIQLPVAGIKIPTLGGIIAGFLLIAFGMALVF